MQSEYDDITDYQRDLLTKFEAEWPEHAEVLKVVLEPIRMSIDELTKVLGMLAEMVTTTPSS